jgi:hypothetical protein
MKAIVTITIIFFLLISPLVVNAQSGSCNTNGTFVDWKKCLEGSKVSGTITTPVFINNAYKDLYNKVYGSYLCPTANNLLGQGAQYDDKAGICASSIVLNKLALDIFALILAIMFLIFVFLIFRSRIMYITSGDNEEQVKKSKKIGRNSSF